MIFYLELIVQQGTESPVLPIPIFTDTYRLTGSLICLTCILQVDIIRTVKAKPISSFSSAIAIPL